MLYDKLHNKGGPKGAADVLGMEGNMQVSVQAEAREGLFIASIMLLLFKGFIFHLLAIARLVYLILNVMCVIKSISIQFS